MYIFSAIASSITYIDIVGLIALVVGAILVITSIDNAKMIGELQGQLSAYKELPLKDIAESMKTLVGTQKSIIQLLTKRSV